MQRPWTWKSGRASASRSAGEKRQSLRHATCVSTTARYESADPLLFPVVPDV